MFMQIHRIDWVGLITKLDTLVRLHDVTIHTLDQFLLFLCFTAQPNQNHGAAS